MLAVAACACLLSACKSGDFNETVAGTAAMAMPLRLESEQVILTEGQVECGAREDLWEAPVVIGNRTTARLLPKGRNLKFTDDVLAEKGANLASAQVRGDFPAEIILPAQIKEDGPDARIVTTKLQITIQHSCFPSSVPVMGIRKGEFAFDALPVLRYVKEGDVWQLQKVIH
jgi:hypothetical protein